MAKPRKIAKKPRKAAQKTASKEQDTTRKLLLAAGKKLFARKGLNGITVKDLANEAGVNVSLVSYYYEGKEGLYEACLRECGREGLAMAQRLLTPPASPEEFRVRLGLFVDEMYEYFAANLDHVRTILREIENEDSVLLTDYRDIFEETYLNVFGALVDFFRAAQKAAIIRPNLDPHVMSGLFHGAMNQAVRADFLSKRYFNLTQLDPKHREKTRNHLLEIFLQGILSEALPTETRK